MKKSHLTRLVQTGVDPDEIEELLAAETEDAREPLKEAEVARTRASIDRNRRRLQQKKRAMKGMQDE